VIFTRENSKRPSKYSTLTYNQIPRFGYKLYAPAKLSGRIIYIIPPSTIKAAGHRS